ncbi:MAG: zonular occludens toxin domain-containing protein [Clostridiales bacterium]|jgi:hypothetical protein|nr:zonular occludens toxin domain-containing protein [Clostridiales bacterium]
MITIIFGPPGYGKTAFMTSRAIDYMVGDLGQEVLENSRREIRRLQRMGYEHLTMPFRHIVYSDYEIDCSILGYNMRQSYKLSGWHLGLNKDNYPVAHLPPHAVIALDEVQRYYNSRVKQGIPEHVSRFFETHRHYGYTIFLVAQRPALIDRNIRCICDNFIFIEKMTVKAEDEVPIKITWETTEFDSTEQAERYADSREGRGRKGKYVFKDNIFACYNSTSFKSLHLFDKVSNDFEYEQFDSDDLSPQSVIQYNYEHSYFAPLNYYDQKK